VVVTISCCPAGDIGNALGVGDLPVATVVDFALCCWIPSALVDLISDDSLGLRDDTFFTSTCVMLEDEEGGGPQVRYLGMLWDGAYNGRDCSSGAKVCCSPSQPMHE